ncbi:unnamed protein product, partial [Amoebophrya sp. A25]
LAAEDVEIDEPPAGAFIRLVGEEAQKRFFKAMDKDELTQLRPGAQSPGIEFPRQEKKKKNNREQLQREAASRASG